MKKLSEKEIARSKEQLKGSYILGLESVSSRMNSIGKSYLMMNKIQTPEQVLQKCDEVSFESVSRIIDKIFDSKYLSFSIVGAIPDNVEYMREFEF